MTQHGRHLHPNNHTRPGSSLNTSGSAFPRRVLPAHNRATANYMYWYFPTTTTGLVHCTVCLLPGLDRRCHLRLSSTSNISSSTTAVTNTVDTCARKQYRRTAVKCTDSPDRQCTCNGCVSKLQHQRSALYRVLESHHTSQFVDLFYHATRS